MGNIQAQELQVSEMRCAEETAVVLRQYFSITRVPHDVSAKEFLKGCQSFSIKLNDQVYKYYRCGRGPTIMLVHGIHTNLGSMVMIAKDLIKLGFAVVLFDIPSHGEAVGMDTDPVEIRNFIRKICSQIGELYGVVGHSLGVSWALTALSHNLRAQVMIAISPPATARFLVEKFVELNQVEDRLAKLLVNALEDRFGKTMWIDFSPSALVKTMEMSGLIIHGKDDDFIPPIHAEVLRSNWTHAQLELVEGVGHFDIVWSHKVRGIITAYLQQNASAIPSLIHRH